ncbi:MAG TPA: ankyrin repeat domain-containing protein [Humisphaera sp.]
MEDGITPATPVEYWASLGNLNMLDRAVAAGADVNAPGADGYTALHAAAENGHLAVVSPLLDRGADPRARVVNGQTSAELAELAEQQAAASLIRKHLDRSERQGSPAR